MKTYKLHPGPQGTLSSSRAKRGSGGECTVKWLLGFTPDQLLLAVQPWLATKPVCVSPFSSAQWEYS